MTIHPTDPFAVPEDQRSPVRRLRGRLPSPVTIWTAAEEHRSAGLTVSSIMVVDGEPGRIVGVIDEEAELWDIMSSTMRAAITMLHVGDHLMADRFAGILPAPGGKFVGAEWIDTAFGPVPADAPTWAGVEVQTYTPCGYGLLIEATISELHVEADPAAPLVHVRGRYRELG